MLVEQLITVYNCSACDCFTNTFFGGSTLIAWLCHYTHSLAGKVSASNGKPVFADLQGKHLNISCRGRQSYNTAEAEQKISK